MLTRGHDGAASAVDETLYIIGDWRDVSSRSCDESCQLTDAVLVRDKDTPISSISRLWTNSRTAAGSTNNTTQFLADRAYATVLHCVRRRLSSVCDVMYCG